MNSSGGNTIATATVNFNRSGYYAFGATITDSNGLSVLSTITKITVVQIATSFSLSATTGTIPTYNQDQMLTSTFIDQFGNPMVETVDRLGNNVSAPPEVQFTLEPSPFGSINITTASYNTNNGFGLYTAGGTAGSDTVTATANFISVVGGTSNGSSSITLSGTNNNVTNGFLVGDIVLGNGIPANDTIASVVSSTVFTLTTPATATASNVTILVGRAIERTTVSVTSGGTAPGGTAIKLNGLTLSPYDPAGSPAENLIRDGDLSTYYHANAATGVWVGLDLGAARTITQVKIGPRSGYTSSLVGATIQVANNPAFTSATTAYTFTSAPTDGQLDNISLSLTGTYRYIAC